MVRTAYASLMVVCLAMIVSGCGGGGGGGGSTTTNTTGNTNNNIPLDPSLNGSNNANAGTPQTSTNPVTKITVLPTGQSIVAGSTLTFSALASDSGGNSVFIASDQWSWSVNDTTVADLASNADHATLTAKTPGNVTITAKDLKSGVTGSATLTITSVNVNNPGDIVVYHNDFKNGAGPEWSAPVTDITPGTPQHPKTPFLGQIGTGTDTLTLNSLPAHTKATVEFDLFIIRSMDGNTPGYTDVWDLRVQGGPVLLHTTFSNITPTFAIQSSFPGHFYQAYPDTFPGGNHPYQTGAVEANTLGYTFANNQGELLKQDSVYHLKYTFANSDSTLKLNFSGVNTQSTDDESWGVTNVTVSVSP